MSAIDQFWLVTAHELEQEINQDETFPANRLKLCLRERASTFPADDVIAHLDKHVALRTPTENMLVS